MTRREFARPGRGYWAIGIEHPKTRENVGSLWRSAMLYDAAFVFTIGNRYQRQSSDTGNAAAHLPLFHFADLDDLAEHLPHGCPLVGVEMHQDAVPLGEFVHPPRGAYLLGAEDHGLTRAAVDRCHYLVQLEAAQPQSMNVAVAGGIVAWDRYVKTHARLRPPAAAGQAVAG